MEMLPRGKTQGFGFAASLEGGYPFHDGWLLEPQAQLVYQTINIDDFNDGVADVRYSNTDSLAGRIGAHCGVHCPACWRCLAAHWHFLMNRRSDPRRRRSGHGQGIGIGTSADLANRLRRADRKRPADRRLSAQMGD